MTQEGYATNGNEYKWFMPSYDNKYDTYEQPLYNSTTTEVSVTSLIQGLIDRINQLEIELVTLKEIKPQVLDRMKEEVVEEIKNNIGTW